MGTIGALARGMSPEDWFQIKVAGTHPAGELRQRKGAFQGTSYPEASMHSSARRFALPAIAAILFSLALPVVDARAARAQDDGVTAAPVSGAGVARIDAIAGDVAIQRGDSNETLAAVPNAPVLAADYVTTGPAARAEVGFDGRSAVRLGENVQIRFAAIEAAGRQLQLAAGTIALRLFGNTDGQSVIDTPSISVVPRTSGNFRVSVDDNGVTAVTVREGRVDIVTPQGTQPLQPGITLIAEGPAANPAVRTRAAIAFDAFDGYNGERDQIYELASHDSRFVNTDIQGIGDLDQNGRWVDDGTYGRVWMPANVAADWAPYRDGNWTWEDGYGWTWVAAEPWGWAPYHYGRWYFSTAYDHWAWYPPAPGRFAPAWSPALVGFVGFNIGAVSAGVGFGNIGWVPLAPFEAFHPWWGPHATTIVNNTMINNNNVHYRNLTVNNAMTSVTRENFQSGRFGHPYVVSQEELRTIHTVPMQGALPIVPSQANLRFTQRTVSPSLAVRPALDRAFAGRPAVAQRTPFTEQQASVSRATHVALRPGSTTSMPAERAPQSTGAGTPSFSRGAGSVAPSYTRPVNTNVNGTGGAAFNRNPSNASNASNDPWSRFSANRGVDRPNANVNGAPAFARPAVPATTFARPATPGYAQPQYNRQAAPAYSRPAAPAYTRPAAPAYSRPVAPAYTRPAAPAYSRPAAPAYTRPAAPAYSRPAAPARPAPAARATHSDEHRDR